MKKTTFLRRLKKPVVCLLFLCGMAAANAQVNKIDNAINTAADKIEKNVIAWREDIHQHPELGNREFRTSEIVAKHLESLGIEVQRKVGITGVVGILKGDKPGPVVALRADMDGLPVQEKTGLPFASKDKTIYDGKETMVMHACGHDAHTAILMGVAEILAGMKKDLKGTVKFIFQPAEEGAPKGEEGGAELMVKDGVMENPKVDVVFGLHVKSNIEAGKLSYRPGGFMAGVGDMKIVVTGKPSHGAYPWLSVDPIVVAAQIINSLQTIVSRNVTLTQNAAVVTIGAIHAGNRSNIIPEQAEMLGTVRTLSEADEKMVFARIRQVVEKTAEAAGATATLELPYSSHYPVTYNDPALTTAMLPSLQKAAGIANVSLIPAEMGAEDFSFFAQKVPGLFFYLGGMPAGQNKATAPPHHTPEFFIDETGFKTGVKALCNLVLDYMNRVKN